MPSAAWVCGDDLVIEHTTAGGVAPINKNVTYGTCTSNLTGEDKCWITQNLGATNQADAKDDSTEDSAGWYWQFNRKQGYKYDTTFIPSDPAWNSTNDNTACDPVVSGTEWCPVNDPCFIELGEGWRLPTYTEWFNADANGQVGGWDNYTETYSDVLKLHAAGVLDSSTGALLGRGSAGSYWSSTQDSATDGWNLYFYTSYSCFMDNVIKAYGNSVRCLRD